jgi:hypothetical protein
MLCYIFNRSISRNCELSTNTYYIHRADINMAKGNTQHGYQESRTKYFTIHILSSLHQYLIASTYQRWTLCPTNPISRPIIALSLLPRLSCCTPNKPELELWELAALPGRCGLVGAASMFRLANSFCTGGCGGGFVGGAGGRKGAAPRGANPPKVVCEYAGVGKSVKSWWRGERKGSINSCVWAAESSRMGESSTGLFTKTAL